VGSAIPWNTSLLICNLMVSKVGQTNGFFRL
jgi:hypothetical protein